MPNGTPVLAAVGMMRLTAALMELAANQFSNNGCNDLDLRQFFPRVEDRRELMKEYHEWNGDPHEYDPNADYNTANDAAMMSWIASQIEERVEALLAEAA